MPLSVMTGSMLKINLPNYWCKNFFFSTNGLLSQFLIVDSNWFRKQMKTGIFLLENNFLVSIKFRIKFDVRDNVSLDGLFQKPVRHTAVLDII